MLKKIIYTIAIIFILLLIGYRLADEPLPKGKEGPRAEYLTEKMLEALNYKAWKSLGAVAWTYPRGHDYIWDKQANLVQVSWDNYTVNINPENITGEVFENDVEIIKNKDKFLNEAFEYFANDSFWLIAPFKSKDAGTVRKSLTYNNEEALLIQYTSGGVTPGDTYLWLFDKEGKPKSWTFWVSLVPVGGIQYSWENWETLDGVKFSTFHSGLLDIKISNLRTAPTIKELTGEKDPFVNLRSKKK